jgi:hypothetical protein
VVTVLLTHELWCVTVLVSLSQGGVVLHGVPMNTIGSVELRVHWQAQ